LQPILPLLEAMPSEFHFTVPYLLSFVMGMYISPLLLSINCTLELFFLSDYCCLAGIDIDLPPQLALIATTSSVLFFPPLQGLDHIIKEYIKKP
jgi:hypothetical protein